MKHVHYDKIVAKAANMDLVVFSYCNLDMKWSEDKPSQPGVEFIDSNNTNYFLCLPQHKEACLHWLNGGEVQVDRASGEWVVIDSYKVSALKEWTSTQGFMEESLLFRIKPKKEKRLIGVNVKTGKTTSAYEYDSGDSYAEAEVRLIKGNMSDWQFIEIEVEV